MFGVPVPVTRRCARHRLLVAATEMLRSFRLRVHEHAASSTKTPAPSRGATAPAPRCYGLACRAHQTDECAVPRDSVSASTRSKEPLNNFVAKACRSRYTRALCSRRTSARKFSGPHSTGSGHTASRIGTSGEISVYGYSKRIIGRNATAVGGYRLDLR
jgi:hypothetical protein